MNNEHNEILPYYLFYIKELTENVGIRDHFLEWLQRPSGMEVRILGTRRKPKYN